jgi:hypothetical protein
MASALLTAKLSSLSLVSLHAIVQMSMKLNPRILRLQMLTRSTLTTPIAPVSHITIITFLLPVPQFILSLVPRPPRRTTTTVAPSEYIEAYISIRSLLIFFAIIMFVRR